MRFLEWGWVCPRDDWRGLPTRPMRNRRSQVRCQERHDRVSGVGSNAELMRPTLVRAGSIIDYIDFVVENQMVRQRLPIYNEIRSSIASFRTTRAKTRAR